MMRRPVSQKGRGSVRHVIYDTNYWKTWTKTALLAAMGGSGSLSLYGNKEEKHALFADHCISEYSVKTVGRGRELFEWAARPDKRDNHWWDCLVGCAVAASMCGMMPKEWRRSGDATPKRQRRRKLKYGAVTRME